MAKYGKKKVTLFGSFTARTGHDSTGLFQQDFQSSLGGTVVFPLASKTTTISGTSPQTAKRNEGIVAGLDGMMPPSTGLFNSAQPGGRVNAGSGGAGSFATITARGAKG